MAVLLQADPTKAKRTTPVDRDDAKENYPTKPNEYRNMVESAYSVIKH